MIHYNVPGVKRKELAKVISIWLDEPVSYSGAPTFAYRIGSYTVDRDGNLIPDENANADTTERLAEHLYDAGFESDLPEETEERLELSVPTDTLDPAARTNLEAVLKAKGALIKKAIGANDLPVNYGQDGIAFPWFRADASAEENHAYLGLRELLVSRNIDMNEMIYACQLPKNVLHDINTSTKTYPLYIRRICKYLNCKEKDIMSEYSEETRAGIIMPWCYDPAKKLRRQLSDYLHDNDIAVSAAGSKTGVLKTRIEYFLSYGILTDHEVSNLKKLGPEMERNATAYLDIIVDLRNPDKGDAFESLPMAPMKD